MSDQPSAETTCKNCFQEIRNARYCSHCGQKNNVRRITTGRLVMESLSNLFAFDGRFFTTIRYLSKHPGKVPADYIRGRQVRYMNPVRLYFLASIFLLVAMSLTTIKEPIVKFDRTAAKEIVDEEALPDPANEMKAEAIADSLSTSRRDTITGTNLEGEKTPGTLFRMMGLKEKHPDITSAEMLDTLNLKDNLWNNFAYSQAVKLHDLDQFEFTEYFMSKISWVVLFFLPVMAAILKLIYIRRDYYFPEHLIFALYTQSVLFILMSILITLHTWIQSDVMSGIFALLFLGYLFISMKVFYRQGIGKTILKFVLINLLLIPAFTIFFILSMIVVFLLF